MALVSLRLRRALTASSSLLRSSFSATPSSSSSSVLQSHISSPRNALQNPRRIQSLYFHSSLPSSSSRSSFNDDDKISPDTILFEGCDYNHWLITMEFPKDPKPTPEEMVETYVQTLAKVVGSVEEAKKRMYACSTTTYNGFQAVMTEEMSEKFRGLPGVVFILPDSYIDPVNKEYGGDKYINGTIIPRPPPVQYGRSGGRYGDRNRNVDRPPRNDRPREPMQMQQGNQPYDRQGPMQGDGRNYAPQQNYAPGAPQQNYAPGAPPQNYGPRAPPQNYGPGAPQQNFGPGAPQQNYGPGAPQQNYGPGAPQPNYPAQQNYAPQQSYAPPQNYGPGGQGERRDSVPSYQRDYNQGTQGNYPSQEVRDPPQGYQRGYAPPEHRDRGAAPPAGGFGQGTESGYRQPGEAQRFPQGQRSDVYQEKGSYMPGDGQGRY